MAPMGRPRVVDYDKVVEFIIKFKREHDGVGPTLREIMPEVGVRSVSAMAGILDALVKEGRIILGPSARMIFIPGGQWILHNDLVEE